MHTSKQAWRGGNQHITYPAVEAVGVLVGGILPGLGQHAVVPVDVVRVEPDLALLGVLLDGVARLISGQLHLGGGLLGDLADKVEEAVAGVQGDVMPGGHQCAVLVLENAELQSLWGALRSGNKTRSADQGRRQGRGTGWCFNSGDCCSQSPPTN